MGRPTASDPTPPSTTIGAQGAPDDGPPGRRRVLLQVLDDEARSGLALVAAAIIAVAWASSPWSDAYDALWGLPISLDIGDFHLGHDLRHWVVDGLMALFFLVVGLEVKRELVHGDLRDPRKAALPVIAAVGGMVVPALLYLAIAGGGPASRGWGIPMATDIAFALGVLALLGRRVPTALKLFLLTLAVVDDIGAVLVIAVFYSGGLAPGWLAGAAVVVALVIALRNRVGAVTPFVALGIALWLCFERGGIHPTLAGVVMGLLTPARPLSPEALAERWAEDLADELTPAQARELSREASATISPVERLEDALHPWTAYFVVPVFALAAAGVDVRGIGAELTSSVALAVIVGLVVGKPIGILLASVIAVRSGLADLPTGVQWRHIGGAGALAGIGFTVSLFVTGLAFEVEALEVGARAAVLVASMLATVVGVAALFACSRPAKQAVATA